jgi:MFS family permease
MAMLALMTAFWAAAWLLVFGAGLWLSAIAAGAAIIAAGAVFAIGECLQGPTQQALIAQLAPEHLRGRYMALSMSSWSIGWIAGPAIGAFILQQEPLALWPAAAGCCLAAGAGGLFLLSREGALTPFARGAGGYVPARGEAYIALSQARRLTRSSCSFRRDDVYALDPVDHPGVTRVDRLGRARRFVDLPAGSFLSTIAFDNVGRFGYRLLVTAQVSGRTTLYAIDCRGRATVIVHGAPKVEGGSAVAPPAFGRFAGRLIAADESSGAIYAFGAGGAVRVLARPPIPAGGDIGVESVGFVPRRFTRSQGAYLADLGAPGSPTTGTDSILRLTGSRLVGAGVRGGELLTAAEASGLTVVVRCLRHCTARRIGRALDATHAEGHIGFSAR